ncbi:hypothetical protein L484_009306 [Morus notabilis]|uniref:Uncharacterized protein n=1 Tax=Morus notabilis TaxID=981085 RepID=W9QSN0_9ROSA|nr:hypothetical protein L484_009306 [Morus notabilis]
MARAVVPQSPSPDLMPEVTTALHSLRCFLHEELSFSAICLLRTLRCCKRRAAPPCRKEAPSLHRARLCSSHGATRERFVLLVMINGVSEGVTSPIGKHVVMPLVLKVAPARRPDPDDSPNHLDTGPDANINSCLSARPQWPMAALALF